MSDFIIRGYDAAADYVSVADNLRQAELYDADRDTEARLRQFADDILVAEAGVQVVGSVYVVDHIVPTIWRLVVNPSYRNRGIGSALVGATTAKLADRGAKDVEGFFAASDETLAKWYASQGFSDGGKYRSIWKYLVGEV